MAFNGTPRGPRQVRLARVLALICALALASPRPGYKCHPHADPGTTRRMIEVLRFVVGLAADVVRRRAGLVAENALLRQQLIVAQRKIAGRVRWAPWRRFTMGLAARMAPTWRDATLLVQPATILRWHQAGCRAFWRRRSRPSGRPPSARAALIREMATSNPRWGAERLRGELLEAPRRRATLVDLPAESRRVGVRLRAD